MPKIYALLVGINGYASKPLHGCIHDVQSVRAYLESAYPPDRLAIQELTDETVCKPTRQGLIDAFDWFADATEGDTCLFYYSGHGSYAEAPADFANTNGQVQSFVCLDSRQPGGMDLIDKELAYLIWKVNTRASGASFVVITDCCHSGTITKAGELESGATERMYPAESGHVPARASACLGYNDWVGGRRAYREEWTPDGTLRVSVEQARHIHVAACGDSQTAKELAIGGKHQGAFTHTLLHHLYAFAGQIGYGQLLEQVAASVKNLAADQRPLINFNGGLVPAAGLNQRFLSQQATSAGAQYSVYRHAQYGWCVRAGTVDQVFKGDRIVVQGDIESRVIASPAPNLSILQNRLELESIPLPAFAAVDRNPSPLALRVSFAPGLPENVRKSIRDAFAHTGIRNVQLDEEKSGTYVIHVDSRSHAYLALAGTTTPVFASSPVQDASAAQIFIEQISRLQNWQYVKTLDNPRTTLDPSSYRIELFEIDGGMPFDEQRWIAHDPAQQLIDLTYQVHAGVWTPPLVRIAVTNRTASTLWVSHAYLAFDFGISTHYFRLLEIPPGERHWLTFDYAGSVSEFIALQLEDRYVRSGHDRICEYIKLFLSTGDPISTHGLTQSGIAGAATHDATAKSRDDDFRLVSSARPSWQAATLGFRIRHGTASP